MRRRVIYFLLVSLFCLAWASGFTAAKLALTTSPPALFGGFRFLFTGTALLGYAAWQGMSGVSAGLATIIASLNPILIAALAAPLLGEAMHWRKVVGLLLGFAGAVFIVRHRLAGGSEDPQGVLLVFGALLCLVVGTIAFKWFAPAVTFEDPGLIVVGVRFWLVMAWCVLVMSIGALLLWFWLLRNGSASSASALHFLIPPTGLAMSWLVLGETISPADLLGIIPVALGIWLATRPAPVQRAAAA